MADPVIEEAHNVLQAVSDDPMAREIARLRANAQVTRRLEEAALRQEGQRIRGARRGAAQLRSRGSVRRWACAPNDAAMARRWPPATPRRCRQLFNALVRDRAWAS
jgi:hypothetical protein